MAFFWQLDCAAHFSSSAFLLCILKQPHHVSVEKPLCQLKLFVGFSLHPEQFSWQLWLKFLSVYLTLAWYQQNLSFSTSLSEFELYWLAFSNLWVSFYVFFLFYKVQLPSFAGLLTVLLLSPWLRIQQSQCSTGWNAQGSVKRTETHWLLYTDTNYKQTGHRCRQLPLIAI